jgi:hypothetical protein
MHFASDNTAPVAPEVSPPWGAIFCHAESHIHTDECGAPEFFGNGLKLVGLAGAAGKIGTDDLQAALAGYGGHSPHQVIASALSITQATEAGTFIELTKSPRWRRSRGSDRSRSTWMAPVLPMRWSASMPRPPR